MAASSRQFTSLLRLASNAGSWAAVEAALSRSAGFFGAAYFLHGVRRDSEATAPFILSNYPKDWRRRYDKLHASRFDPVLRHAERTTQPFT